MKETAISVIIPFCNASTTLRRCLDSVLNQTFSDMQIILVDDGSTDDSFSVCNDYALRYPFVLLLHQENHGVSSARNLGLHHADGRYVVFIDADDEVLPDFLSTLLQGIHDADICIANTQLVYIDGRKVVPPIPSAYLATHDEMARLLIRLDECGSPLFVCGYLFRSDIIRQNNLVFDISIHVCEDSDFLMRYLSYAGSMQFLSDANYIYYLPPDNKVYTPHNGLYASIHLLDAAYHLTENENIRALFRRKYMDWTTEELFYYDHNEPLHPLAQQYGRLCQPYLSESRRPSFRHRFFKHICIFSDPVYIIFASRVVMFVYKVLKKCKK